MEESAFAILLLQRGCIWGALDSFPKATQPTLMEVCFNDPFIRLSNEMYGICFGLLLLLLLLLLQCNEMMKVTLKTTIVRTTHSHINSFALKSMSINQLCIYSVCVYAVRFGVGEFRAHASYACSSQMCIVHACMLEWKRY